MSQVKLNLQPPPNVDFVTGYPGIPPGPDRPQASVKGAIEVRVPPQGVKAKWVRIELRKVETLPGGGPSNTYYDFVGPSPVNLWSTSDEYSLLRSQDFPFSIRIPESIPPTISLDSKAGIGYELVASVCTKGKKGFLRKAKSVVVTSTAPIIIDKHELHSTWPVYCQAESRQLAQEGVNLIVERNQTCYGPGDRVSVLATVKSDSVHTVILRGFEFYLKEATVFRAGAHAVGKKNAPQVKQFNIAENKVAVNATLYGGTSHTAELSCMISDNHTTTTLNAARHIDVTYTLCIKALMGTGTQLSMDLPVIISNWQRHVSFEAISRIGPAPSLSLLPPHQPTRGRPADAVAATLPINRANLDGGAYGHARNNSASAFNTLQPTSSTAKPAVDDFLGIGRTGNGIDEFGTNRPPLSTSTSGLGGTSIGVMNASGSSSLPSRAPAASAATSLSATNRFAVKNAQPQEIPVDTRTRSPQAAGPSGSGSAAAAAPKHWPTAEEEKLKLYEEARSNVAKTQGLNAAPPPASASIGQSSSATSSPSRGPSATAASTQKAWLSADEEKRLFQQAQEAVKRTQGLAAQPIPSAHTRNDSDPKSQISSGSGSKPSGAALYAQAMSAQNRSAGSSAQAGGSSVSMPTKPVMPQYMTAEQEKAALRRYEEAKRAVDRTQNAPEDSAPSHPIAYESLFPAATATATRAAPAAASSSSPPPISDLPPSFESAAGGSNIMAHLSEKERLRSAYEAQDAAAQARQIANPSPPPVVYPMPAPAPAPAPTPAPSLPGQYANALEEKEALRRKFEARDNAQAARAAPTPQPPPRSNTGGSTNVTDGNASPARSPGANATGFRPTPVPPVAGAKRVLTAAEEKALLRAKFEARDAGNAHKTPPPAVNGTPAHQPSTPPPLMPRPPVEYIKETQEEDARVSRLNGELPNLDGLKLNGSVSSTSVNNLPPSGVNPLDMKPFTPFRAGFETTLPTPGPPPPLPRQSDAE